MQSVRISRFGGPETLELFESAAPRPGLGQVRVRVRAIGVNFADILMRMGLYPGAPALPFVPGYEAAGEIESAGQGSRWKPGERVIVPTNYGGYSDTLLANDDEVFAIPNGRSFEAAAALTVNYLTAYEALIGQGGLREGQSVLIHGAAGGVGVAAAQLCRILRAKALGTCSASKHEFALSQGVTRCIDARAEDFEPIVRRETGGRGVDVALDPIGGDSFRKSYRCLAPGGKLILYGFSASAPGRRRSLPKVLWQYVRTPRFSSFDLMLDNRGVIGLHLGRLAGEKPRLASAMRQLVDWWEDDRISPVVGATFPLSAAAQAHAYIQNRESVGKVVLTIP